MYAERGYCGNVIPFCQMDTRQYGRESFESECVYSQETVLICLHSFSPLGNKNVALPAGVCGSGSRVCCIDVSYSKDNLAVRRSTRSVLVLEIRSVDTVHRTGRAGALYIYAPIK